MDDLGARITLARRIDSAQHRIKKTNHERKWAREVADALEVDIDSDSDARCRPFSSINEEC